MSEDSAAAPRIGILDYGMGNLRSVHRAFIAAGANATVVEHPHQMTQLQALVFPGQGAIVDTMRLLHSRGWPEFLKEWIALERPFFGICLGMQALFDYSEEGGTEGLSIFPGTVRRFDFPIESGIKIPHMGWNNVAFTSPEDPILEGISPSGDQFYFVHSYYVVPDDASSIWGTTDYGDLRFCSAVRRRNLFATQFHPEKSQSKGLQLYRNFVKVLNSGCE
ncbi:MAG TPA: imidazole glycerol phosphate synthase subunit HisH [Oceanipulchritudo sp.]|nr:imidazole glycerol phosphate synthase subunit HisH [Oceanipulchritudo sp.]